MKKNKKDHLPFRGKLDSGPQAPWRNKAVCYWHGIKYSPGAKRKEGNITYICNDDGTWGEIEVPKD